MLKHMNKDSISGPTEEQFLKFYTQLWAETSRKQINWQTRNNENQSITIQKVKNTLTKTEKW
jgi:hypothetical protein